jgi:hypothetical protein
MKIKHLIEAIDEDHYTVQEILEEDAGMFTLSNDWLRMAVACAFYWMPADDVDEVMRKSRFAMPKPGEYASVIPSRPLRDKYLVLISETIKDLPENVRAGVLVHEAAHVLLEHIDIDASGAMGSPGDSMRAEQEADEKVEEWMGEDAAEYLEWRTETFREEEALIKEAMAVSNELDSDKK